MRHNPAARGPQSLGNQQETLVGSQETYPQHYFQQREVVPFPLSQLTDEEFSQPSHARYPQFRAQAADNL